MHTATISFFLFALLTQFSTHVFAGEANLSWNPNSEADLAGYKVYYGTSSQIYGAPIDVGNQTAYTLTGLPSGATYYFAVTAYDTSSNESDFSAEASKSIPATDITPPVFSAVSANSISATSENITWQTNEPATSRVEYGTTTAFGSFSALNSSKITSHSRTLSNLSADTTYYYRLISEDTAGNTAVSGNFSFTTASLPDTVPPVLSNINVDYISQDTAIITWESNEPATSQVVYGDSPSYGNATPTNTTHVTGHQRTLTNLFPATTYYYRAVSVDTAGHTTASDEFSFTTAATADTTPPVLLNIDARNISSSTTHITWETDEPASSQVRYGETETYDQATPLTQQQSSNHQLILSQLLPGKLYHYRVESVDPAGNFAASEDRTFTTELAPINNPNIHSFTNTPGDQEITLEWFNPDNPAFVGVRIRFRNDRPPNDIEDGSHIGDFPGQPNEKVTFLHKGLKNGETYYYIAAAYDDQGHYQEAVTLSAKPNGTLSNESNVAAGGGGGCGLIFPSGGNPPGPGDAAGMLTMMGVMLFILLKKSLKTLGSASVAK